MSCIKGADTGFSVFVLHIQHARERSCLWIWHHLHDLTHAVFKHSSTDALTWTVLSPRLMICEHEPSNYFLGYMILSVLKTILLEERDSFPLIPLFKSRNTKLKVVNIWYRMRGDKLVLCFQRNWTRYNVVEWKYFCYKFKTYRQAHTENINQVSSEIRTVTTLLSLTFKVYKVDDSLRVFCFGITFESCDVWRQK